MVINKPSGMTVNESQTAKDLTVQKWFAQKITRDPSTSVGMTNSEFEQKGGVVHRLDKDTSGLMVLAKTEVAYNGLKQQFLERQVHKEYVALVHGMFDERSGIISAPIDRHPVVKTKFTVSANLSRTAITNWEVEEEFTMNNVKFTMLKLEPLTGRTHQLRVHMQYIGHPIVGDKIYGHQKHLDTGRLFLHARKLVLVHPLTGKGLEFDSKLPEALVGQLESLVH